MTDMTDREAIRLCQGDDDHGHGAFRVLYDRYFELVAHALKRLLRHPQRIDEAVQETFVRFYRSRQRYEPDKPLRPYLLRIAHNVALDLLSKDKTQQQEPDEPVTERDAPQIAATKELGRGLDAALQALAPQHRSVILLRHIHGLKFSDIALALDCTERTARNRLRAAAILLERQLERRGLLDQEVTR